MHTEPMTTDRRDELELVFRPWRGLPDAVEMARIANAANAAVDVDEHVTVEDLMNSYGHPDEHADAAKDLVVVEHDGQMVAYAWHSWIDTNDGLREHRTGAYVDPGWLRRGIGHRLIEWLEARARASRAEHPTDAPAYYATWSHERRLDKHALLAKAGYRQVRWFYEMARDLRAPIEVPPLPTGIEVRPMNSDRDRLHQLFAADAEAFRDHWGGFAGTEARFREWVEDPSFDPSLHVVAWDREEIAGAVINTIYRSDNEAFGRRRGWLDSVFVRRAWRRRGLAAALVARSLVVLRDAGMDEGMLGVDADNPTGALGVYERAGFRVVTRSIAFRKAMESTS